LNPSAIKVSIQVLMPASSIYGSRAANGAIIVVTTKNASVLEVLLLSFSTNVSVLSEKTALQDA
jgi:outer membrane receptor for ferrienterochelin and colicin